MSSYKREKEDAADVAVMKAEASVGLVNMPAEEAANGREYANGEAVSPAEEQSLLLKTPEDSLDKLV